MKIEDIAMLADTNALKKEEYLKNRLIKILNMKNYYIAKFRVIVDGKDHSIETVSGQGYDPNIVKGKAEERARKDNPGKRVTAVLIEKTDMNLEEYKKATGGTPGWLGGSAANH